MATAATTDGGADGDDSRELGAAVEAEVLRLPEKYRAVVVLCYWEGLTHEEAALRLGCPLGTVRSRIARARKLLERRLSRRGLQPVASVMAAALDSPAMMSTRALEIPPALLSSTVKLATQVAAGGSLTTLTSPAIAALVQKIIGSMLMTKVKTIALCVLLISAGAYGLALAAAQTERGRQKTVERRPTATASSKSKAQPPLEAMNAYVVGPTDLMVVEVLEALPGRPISGERVVRPDGTISLGFYGDVYVAGLTVAEIKTKIIKHLKQHLSDEALGLTRDDENGSPEGEADTGKPKPIDARESTMVFVDITAYNSKNYYVQGEVVEPQRCPAIGQDRVLDAISYAGGLTSEADHDQVFLYREVGEREPVQTLKIDVDQIMLGDDLSTNYQLFAGDRLVIRRRGALPREKDAPASPAPSLPEPKASSPTVNRSLRTDRAKPADAPLKQHLATRETPALQRLERRMSDMERKLDLILEAVKRPGG